MIPGVWEPFLNWIDGVAEPLVEPTRGAGLRDERRRGGARRGRHLARAARVRGRPRARRRRRRAHDVSTHKLYFDELYDAVFSRPAQLIANRLRDDVEGPIVQGSLGEIGAGVRDVAGGTARLQSGLLRSYALVIAGSVAVLVVVFLAVR